MSADGLSQLFAFSPKIVPPFSDVKSGFKFSPLVTDANGKTYTRVFLYDDALVNVSELRVYMTSDVFAANESNMSSYIISKLGLNAVYVAPVPREIEVAPTPEPVPEPAVEPAAEEPVPEPTAEEPVPEPATEPVPEPVAEPTPEPAVEEPNPNPNFYYLILDDANRMVFPNGFARDPALNIVDASGRPVVFAQMKMENEIPVIYSILETNSDHIPVLPVGSSKSAEGHINTPDGGKVVISYSQFVRTA